MNLFSFLKGKKPPVKTAKESLTVRNGLEAKSEACTIREGLEAKSGVFVIQDDSLKTRSNVYVLQDEFEKKDLIKDIQHMQQLAITTERNLINSKLHPAMDERPKLTVINGGKRGRM